MTPGGALTAAIARLTAAGLVEARSPLGVVKASSQRVNRSFSVLPSTLGPASKPDRGRPNLAGLRVSQVFTVALGHQIKPGDGQEAPTTALADLHTAWKSLSEFGNTLSDGAAIQIGSASMAYEGGGAFMVTTFPLTVTYNLDLTP